MTRMLSIALLVLLSGVADAEAWQARYGVQYVLPFKLYNADGTLDVDESDGGTEVSVRCQGGTNATATNDFVDKGSDYEITLTATEMQCATIIVTVAATNLSVDYINTVNNSSAAIPTLDSDIQEVGGSALSTSTAQLGVNVVNAAGTAWNSGAIGASTLATDTLTAAKIATDAGTELGTATWATTVRALTVFDEDTTTMDLNATAFGSVAGNVTGSVGAIASAGITNASFSCSGAFPMLGITDCGTATASSATSLTIRTAATFADNELEGQTVLLSSGTGVGQARSVDSNDDDILTVPTWTTTASSTAGYVLFGTASGAAGAGGGDATEAKQDTILANLAIVDTVVDAILVDTGTTLDDLVDDLESRMGTPSNLGGGATLAANLSDVEGQTDDIGVAGAGLTAADDSVMTRLGAPVGASLSVDLAAVKADSTAILVDTSTTLDDMVDDLETRLGTPSNLGGGATVAANLSDVEAQTDDIGTAGAGLTAADDAVLARLGTPAGASVSADVADIKTDSAAILVDTGTTLQAELDGIQADTEDLQTQVGTAGAGLTAADDAVMTRLGAAAGASVSADIAAVKADSAAILVDTGTTGVVVNAATITAAVWDAVQEDHDTADTFGAFLDSAVSGVSTGGISASEIADEVQTRTIAGVTTVAGLGANAITAAAIAPDAGTELGTATWATTVRTLTSGLNIALAKGTGVTGLNDLDAAGIRSAVGLSSANLATLIDALPLLTEIRDLVVDDADNATLACVLSSLRAYAVGRSAVVSSTTTYRDPTNAETRVVGTAGPAGRSAITITCPSF